jgi:hypothetical protein
MSTEEKTQTLGLTAIQWLLYPMRYADQIVIATHSGGNRSLMIHPLFEESGIGDMTWIAIVNPLHIPY